MRLIGVSKTTHSAHNTKNVVIGGKNANLGSAGTLNSGVRQNELKGGIVNAREVATAAWLVLFGAQGKRVQVDTGVGVAGVVLPRLNEVEVGAFALREAVLAVELQLGSDNGVLTPAVHVEGGLGEHESAGVRQSGLLASGDTEVAGIAGVVSRGGPEIACKAGASSRGGVVSAGLGKQTANIDGAVGAADRMRAAERVNGVGQGIDSIGVVEGLGTEKLEQQAAGIQG